MAFLGKLGVVRPPEVVDEETTFEWFGTVIRLPVLQVSELELVDLMEQTTQTDEDNPSAIVVVKNLFRMVIHPDDFGTFWDIAKQQRQQIADLMPVFQALLEAATSRPTQRPSGSSAGQPPTQANSEVDSSSPASDGPSRPDLVLLLEGGRQTREQLEAAARVS